MICKDVNTCAKIQMVRDHDTIDIAKLIKDVCSVCNKFVPRTDKIPQYEPVYGVDEATAAYNYIIGKGWCGDFQYTRQLEDMIKSYTGSRFCVIVSSGTIALQIALMAIGVNQNHNVVVPDYTMPATAYAVSLCGANVRFIDVSKDTFNFKYELFKNIDNKYDVKIIIPVHINGRSCVHPFITQYTCIEDACQSMGSFYRGKHLGTFSGIGVLSLNMFKLISTGQGGVLLTDDENLYIKMRKIKDFGRLGGRGAVYEILGMNAKFNDLLAVVGIEQFKKIEHRIESKKNLWEWYTERLADIDEVHFIETNLNDCTPWYIDPLVAKRDELIGYLAEKGIETQPFYGPLHRLPYYKYLGLKDKDFPGTCFVSENGIWLPSSTNLSESTVDMICGRIREFYENS